MLLEIIPRVSPCCPDVFFHVPPECKNHIDDDWGAYCKQGGIDKILTDLAGSDAHSIPDGGTNTKSIPFNETLESVHTANLKNPG